VPPMPSAERERLLHEQHVAVLSVARSAGPPLALPIWYEYRDGLFYMDTDTETLHAKLMTARGEATLTVQDENQPYRYVSVEGHIEFVGDDLEHARRIIGRYLPQEAIDGFIVGVRKQFQPNAQTAVLTPNRKWSAWFPEGSSAEAMRL